MKHLICFFSDHDTYSFRTHQVNLRCRRCADAYAYTLGDRVRQLRSQLVNLSDRLMHPVNDDNDIPF